MSECTGHNSLMMGMNISRVKSMALANDIFETLRGRLNELKNDDLITDETVLPFAFGLLTEAGRAYTESHPDTEKARQTFSKLLKIYMSDIMPWDDLVANTMKDNDL